MSHVNIVWGRAASLNVAVAIAVVQDARSEPQRQVERGYLVAPPG
jgi:hypothetical protein